MKYGYPYNTSYNTPQRNTKTENGKQEQQKQSKTARGQSVIRYYAST